MKMGEKIFAFFAKRGEGEKLQRLKDIEVREVSLVDHPAIDERFTEIKRRGDLDKTKEEGDMDEKKVAELIQSALAPLTQSVSELGQKLEAQGKAVADLTDRMSGEKGMSADMAALAQSIDEIKKSQVELVKEAGERFDEIEKFVSQPRSSKISGQQEGDENGEKSVKWPTLAGLAR